MPENTDIAVVKLQAVRLSFPHLFKAHAQEEGKEPQFSATFIMDNTVHGALLDEIESKIERVALDFFKKKVRFRTCLRDGNDYADKDGYGDGVSFIAARRATRPGVVDRQCDPLTEEDGVIYAGCYVNATIRLFAYDHKTGGKGVSAGLNNVQFYKDGESFGAGNTKPEDDFEKYDEAGGPVGSTTRPRSRRSESPVNDPAFD